VVGTHDLATLLGFGRALADVVAGLPEPPLIVVSSDMTHYESVEAAAAKDRGALDALAAVDPEGLHTVVRQREISMCGVAPAIVGLAALRRLGVRTGELTVYTHSGVVTGDRREVVAYAGMVFRA
jgi:AmmeMemoRadiSam system protein B